MKKHVGGKNTFLISFLVIFSSLLIPWSAHAKDSLDNSPWELNPTQQLAVSLYRGNPFTGKAGAIVALGCVNNGEVGGISMNLGFNEGAVDQVNFDVWGLMMYFDGSVDNPDFGIVMTFDDGTRYAYQISQIDKQDFNGTPTMSVVSYIGKEAFKKLKTASSVTFHSLLKGAATTTPTLEAFSLKGSAQALSELKGCEGLG